MKALELVDELIKRALGDVDSLMSLYLDVVAERDALKAELERIKALEPVALDHIACICDGELRYMSGRCAPVHDCELYAMPEGKAAPALYALGSKTNE